MDLEPSLLKEEIERNHEEGQVGETPKRFISRAEPHTLMIRGLAEPRRANLASSSTQTTQDKDDLH